ncbi:peptidase U32 family protein [Desertivirga arenae]|uniref:peptidase U32 family protein n=1 Tax=Desertivirga arenae TaxID=2810309 RepID=UPI001A95F9BE|nr:peptidase U32 family protein [Pedobacter sp. SYSU D00823]
MKIPELLSPVGSYDSLYAAVRAGADSVYFGIEQLNMRAKSVNAFFLEDLEEIGRIAKDNSIKCYLTLNTVIYNHDLKLAEALIKEAKKCGIDAVIASDYAIIQLCDQEGMPLHISTQANITNIQSVAFHSKFADVVVLSRELTLKQIEEISREIIRRDIKGPSGRLVRIEVFVHGALCMAVSGKCYISLHTQNASANRGACSQNCRRPYKVIDYENGHELLVDNEYIMSPKDLCTIDILDQVIAAGVNVLKIEGRTKSAEYVYTTTKCYRQALDAIEAGNYDQEKVEQWKTELNKVYNRGFWEGYYLGRELGEWTSYPGNQATQKKVYVGKGSNYFHQVRVAEFIIETGSLKKGDTILITGTKKGVMELQLEEFRVDGIEKSEAAKGQKLTLPLTDKISKGDKLYKIVS